MRIGIDVGGTKIEGLLLADEGTEVARHRVATPSVYEAVLEAISAVVAKLESESESDQENRAPSGQRRGLHARILTAR